MSNVARVDYLASPRRTVESAAAGPQSLSLMMRRSGADENRGSRGDAGRPLVHAQ